MQAHDNAAGRPRAPTGIDEESRHDALDVLYDVLGWRMSSARWEHVARLVDAMTSALSDGDGDTLRAATIHLELASPIRVPRIGDTPQGPPPEPVRDRVNYLVHSLGGDKDKTQQDEQRDRK